MATELRIGVVGDAYVNNVSDFLPFLAEAFTTIEQSTPGKKYVLVTPENSTGIPSLARGLAARRNYALSQQGGYDVLIRIGGGTPADTMVRDALIKHKPILEFDP